MAHTTVKTAMKVLKERRAAEEEKAAKNVKKSEAKTPAKKSGE